MYTKLIAIGAIASLLLGCSSPNSNHSEQLNKWRSIASPAPAAKAADVSAIPSDDWAQEMLRNHPAVHSKIELWLQAIEQLPQASALPDPKLSMGIFLNSLETRNGPAQGKLSLNQALPWPGSLSNREALSMAQAEVRFQELVETIHNLWARLIALQSERELLVRTISARQSQLNLLSQGEEVLRIKWRDGQANQAKLLNLQMQMAKVEDEIRSLQGRQPLLNARARALLGRSAKTPISWPDFQETNVSTEENSIEFAPSLQVAQSKVAMSEALIAAVRSNNKPNLGLGVEWTPIGNAGMPGSDSGSDALAIGFGMELPIQQQSKTARLNAALAGQRAAIANRLALRQSLEQDQAQLIYSLDDAQQRISLYSKGLIPKGQQTLNTSLSAFANHKGDFQDYLDAVDVLIEFELAQSRATHQAQVASAKLLVLYGQSPLSHQLPTQP